MTNNLKQAEELSDIVINTEYPLPDDDLIRRGDVLAIIQLRAFQSRGLYGDLGGAASGIAKIVERIPPSEQEKTMTDNDLIRRRDAINACYNGWNMDEDTVMNIHSNIAEIQAVKQPMSAVEFMKVIEWLDYYDHDTYQLYLAKKMRHDYAGAVAVVERWAREHPEEVNNERIQ